MLSFFRRLLGLKQAYKEAHEILTGGIFNTYLRSIRNNLNAKLARTILQYLYMIGMMPHMPIVSGHFTGLIIEKINGGVVRRHPS